MKWLIIFISVIPLFTESQLIAKKVQFDTFVKCFENEIKIDRNGNLCNCLHGNWICPSSCGCSGNSESNCKPSEIKIDGKKKCRCDGGKWTCLEDSCTFGECISGTVGTSYCNNCSCTNGFWSCTKIGCIPPIPEGAPHGHKIYYDCNECVLDVKLNKWNCTSNVCQKVDCFPGDTIVTKCKKYYCEAGKWKKIYVNSKECDIKSKKKLDCCTPGDIKIDKLGFQCRCTKNSLWACNLPKICECKDGEIKNQACNKCFCTNGMWACTKMGCPDKKYPPECKANERKQINCNTCRCDEGNWACESNKCPGMVCEPGKPFKMDCNTCICNEDGTPGLCTLMACVNKTIPIESPTT